MSDKSAIEWTEATWNVVTGCTKVSPACANCYAAAMARRFPAQFGDFARVTMHPDLLEVPRHWRNPRRVFVCSMGDLFHQAVPAAFIDRVWQTMIDTPRHTYMVLTKRSDRMWAMSHCAGPMSTFPPPANIWLGVTVENQEMADLRLPDLRATNAAVRFVSCEPLLGPIDLIRPCSAIDWVIVGGENGPGARPMDPAWALDLWRQTRAAGAAFWWKGWGRQTRSRKYRNVMQNVLMTITRQLPEVTR